MDSEGFQFLRVQHFSRILGIIMANMVQNLSYTFYSQYFFPNRLYSFVTTSLALILLGSNFIKINPEIVLILLKATYAMPYSKILLPRSITALSKEIP